MSFLVSFAGSLGFILFATACVPMAWKTIRSGQAVVTDRVTIWTFVAATWLVTFYLVGISGINLPSFLSLVEFICWCIVAKYSYVPDYDCMAEIVLDQSPDLKARCPHGFMDWDDCPTCSH